MEERKQNRLVGAIFFGVGFVFMWKILHLLLVALTPLSASPIIANSIGAAIGAGAALYLTNKWFPDTFKTK